MLRRSDASSLAMIASDTIVLNSAAMRFPIAGNRFGSVIDVYGREEHKEAQDRDKRANMFQCFAKIKSGVIAH
jgi:hypothetical protein